MPPRQSGQINSQALNQKAVTCPLLQSFTSNHVLHLPRSVAYVLYPAVSTITWKYNTQSQKTIK